MFKSRRKNAVIGFVSAFSALAVIAAAIPFINTKAEAVYNSVDGIWEVTGNDISAYKGSDSDVTIPSQVVCISDKDIDENGVLDDEITVDIQNVRRGVFAGNKDLKSLTVSEGIVTLGTVDNGRYSSYIFDGCTNLSKISLPTTLTGIGDHLLESCAVTELELNCNILTGNFYGTTSLEKLTISEGVTDIPRNMFGKCTGIKQVKFPESLKTIGTLAFAESGLTSVNIPATVEKVDEGAFQDCSSLEEVTCGAEIIGRNAFREPGNGHATITKLTLLEGVKTISDFAFYFQPIKNKGELVIPDTVETIGENAFNGTVVSTLTCGKNLKSIGDYAFNKCENLKKLNLNEGLETIGKNAFQECPLTGTLTIPNGVKEIGARAFESHYIFLQSSITKLILPDTLEKIGESAFNHSATLKTVEIPDSVTVIEPYAFHDCPSLSELKLPNNIKTITKSSFGNIGVTSLVIPDSVTEIEDEAFNASSSLKTLTFGKNVESIGKLAFCHTDSLEEVNFNDGLKKIGEAAFMYSGLPVVSFPDSVVKIDETAFDASGLVEIKNWSADLDTLGSAAFASCAKLSKIPPIPAQLEVIEASVFSDCITLDNIVIEEGIREIGDFAFFGIEKGISEITIPDSVTYIGQQAFGNCRNLSKVNLGKNVETLGHQCFVNTNKLTEITVPDSLVTFGLKCLGYIYDEELGGSLKCDTFTIYGSTDEAKAYAEENGFLYNPESKPPVTTTVMTTEPVITTTETEATTTVPDTTTAEPETTTTTVPDTTTTEAETTTTAVPDTTTTEPETTTTAVPDTTTTPENTTTTVPTTTERPKGDISGNGKIDLYDAINIAEFLVKKRTYTEEEMKMADFNGDGKVDLYDAIAIATYMLKHPLG